MIMMIRKKMMMKMMMMVMVMLFFLIRIQVCFIKQWLLMMIIMMLKVMVMIVKKNDQQGHACVGKKFPTWTKVSDADMSASEATFRHGRKLPTRTCPRRQKLADADRSLICRRGQMSASDPISSASEELKITIIIIIIDICKIKQNTIMIN